MKKLVIFVVVLVFVLGTAGLTMAGSNPMKAKEKEFLHNLVKIVPKDHIISVKQFHKVYKDVIAGKKKACLLDVRTHPEFYAFHIEGTNHMPVGLMYLIPKKIKDPNTTIYVFCRTGHRAKYAAGLLYNYGYKNVYLYDGGVVGWAKAGYPLVNQLTGVFKIQKYSKAPSKLEKSFHLRQFHPY